MAGFGLLYPNLRSNNKSSLAHDSLRYLQIICTVLSHGDSPSHQDFQNIISAMLTPQAGSVIGHAQTSWPCTQFGQAQPRSHQNGHATGNKQQGVRSHNRAVSAKFARVKSEPGDNLKLSEATMAGNYCPSPSGLSDKDALGSLVTRPLTASHRPYSFPTSSDQLSSNAFSLPNLDYLDFGNEPAMDQDKAVMAHNYPFSPPQQNENAFSPQSLPYTSAPTSSESLSWSPDIWDNTLGPDVLNANTAFRQSDESLTSGEEMMSCDGKFMPQDFLSAAI